jgi:hypothetical protein
MARLSKAHVLTNMPADALAEKIAADVLGGR